MSAILNCLTNGQIAQSAKVSFASTRNNGLPSVAKSFNLLFKDKSIFIASERWVSDSSMLNLDAYLYRSKWYLNKPSFLSRISSDSMTLLLSKIKNLGFGVTVSKKEIYSVGICIIA